MVVDRRQWWWWSHTFQQRSRLLARCIYKLWTDILTSFRRTDLQQLVAYNPYQNSYRDSRNLQRMITHAVVNGRSSQCKENPLAKLALFEFSFDWTLKSNNFHRESCELVFVIAMPHLVIICVLFGYSFMIFWSFPSLPKLKFKASFDLVLCL